MSLPFPGLVANSNCASNFILNLSKPNQQPSNSPHHDPDLPSTMPQSSSNPSVSPIPSPTNLTPTSTGTCLCTLITYTLPLTSPTLSLLCHCTMCQRTSGSAFAYNLLTPRSSLTINPSSTPHLRHYDHKTEAGNVIRRVFCGTCSTGIYNALVTPVEGTGEWEEASGMVSVLAGPLDGEMKRRWPPTVEGFCGRKNWEVEVRGARGWEEGPPGEVLGMGRGSG